MKVTKLRIEGVASSKTEACRVLSGFATFNDGEVYGFLRGPQNGDILFQKYSQGESGAIRTHGFRSSKRAAALEAEINAHAEETEEDWPLIDPSTEAKS